MTEAKKVEAERNELLAAHVIKNLEKRNFEACYCATAKEAVEKIISMISETATVSWGGSYSLTDTGLLDSVKQKFSVIDRDTAKTPEERTELMRKSLCSDVFLTSFNAVSEDGVVINIDGNGNRVAAITYGPTSVIAMVGMNKISKTQETALVRARTVAAPLNVHRFGRKTTGCALTGSCQDCLSQECICNVIQTLRRNPGPKGRIKVVLVGEELGF
ncbi:MAG: lactate utilization protein [Treponema sp.]|nr:lactate utilization protein [Candidatus Treponema equifaecale]